MNAATSVKTNLLPVEIVKKIDACSPPILQAVANQFASGGIGSTDIVEFRTVEETSPSQSPVLIIRFELATIISSELIVDDPRQLVEKITLQVGRISHTWHLAEPGAVAPSKSVTAGT